MLSQLGSLGSSRVRHSAFGCPLRRNAFANAFANGWRPGRRAQRMQAGVRDRRPASATTSVCGGHRHGDQSGPHAAPRPRFRYTDVGVDKGGRMQ